MFWMKKEACFRYELCFALCLGQELPKQPRVLKRVPYKCKDYSKRFTKLSDKILDLEDQPSGCATDFP